MDVDVSVIIPTYNHEEYIETAIKSVLMQKINFNMEVFIGEDCSTDNTRMVLKKLEPSLPVNYKIIYRDNNLRDGNFGDLYSRMSGKYFIILEGDDYWTYEYKLQNEYDFLEQHKDYVAVAHNAQVVDENGKSLKWRCHECYKNEYTIYDFRKGLFPGQTATVLRRNYFKYPLFDYDINIPAYPGDRIKAFLMVANGRVWCFQEKWSAYRLVISHGSSCAANLKRQYEKDLHFYESLFNYSRRNNCNKDVCVVTEQLLSYYLFSCLLKKRCGINLKRFCDSFNSMKFPIHCILYIFYMLLSFPVHYVEYIYKERQKREAIVERINTDEC